MAGKNWMADHQLKTLAELHLPGSHDAGTINDHIELTRLGTDSNSKTQNATIIDQLNYGTRFFDLRLTEHRNRVVAHHTTKGQGAFGTTPVDEMIGTAGEFCSQNGTEVVVIRISHTSASTKADELVAASGGNALHTGTGNLCSKPLRDIVANGGLICIFDEDKFGNVINQGNGIHSYSKYKNNPSNDRGISTCGCYSGTHKLHNVIRNGLRGQFDHTENHNPVANTHLWQVYWQKTYLNPASRTGIEGGTTKRAFIRHRGGAGGKAHGGTHAATAHMIGLMQGHAGMKGEDYNVAKKKKHFYNKQEVIMRSTQQARCTLLPNIISYDFVNEETNKQIIQLNQSDAQNVYADEDELSDEFYDAESEEFFDAVSE